MSITLKQIGLELGVSESLVSYALKGNPRVSEETRQRVLETAKALGYNAQSNRGARALAARRHGTVARTGVLALLLSEPTWPATRVQDNPFFLPYFCGVEMEAGMRDYDLFVCALRQGRLPRLISEGSVDGVIGIHAAESFEELHELKLPVISLGSEEKSGLCLVPDDADGISQAVGHLVELGHQRIAYIGMGRREAFVTARRRLAAYRDALQAHGLPVDETLIEATTWVLETGSGAAQLDTLLARNPSFTAVVCYNDVLAMGVVERLQEIGRRVPGDVAVVGFDGYASETGFKPVLTSVGFNRMEMGRRAVQLMCESLESTSNDDAGQPESPAQLDLYPVQLMRRDTT